MAGSTLGGHAVRYFRAANVTVYEAVRADLDAAWGYPNPDTKTDITPAASMWDKVAALEIVAYKYIGETPKEVYQRPPSSSRSTAKRTG